MTYDFFLAWRHVLSRPLQTLVTTLVVALAVALPVVTFALGDGAREGIIRASDPFGTLVVGAKGSGQQLVLNTLLLQGLPVGNIDYAVYESLQIDPRVALAVPLAMGDNVGGARLIGTSDALLALRPSEREAPAFQVARGRFFSADFEAVLGSSAAEALGLDVGDTFVSSHGVEPGLEDDVHDEVHRVVGVLAPSHSAYDAAVFVSFESIWHAHEEAGEHEEGEGEAPSPFEVNADAGHEQLTAVLVKSVGFVEQGQLWQSFYIGSQAQAVFPGQELGGLFDLLGQGEQLITVVGYVVFAIAALTVFLAIYSATAARERSVAILRSLGSSRTNVFSMVLFETLIIMLIGSLVGRVLGYATAAAVAGVYSQQSAIPIAIRFMPQLELALWLVTLGLGLFAGLLPAALAYRVDVVEKLFSS